MAQILPFLKQCAQFVHFWTANASNFRAPSPLSNVHPPPPPKLQRTAESASATINSFENNFHLYLYLLRNAQLIWKYLFSVCNATWTCEHFTPKNLGTLRLRPPPDLAEESKPSPAQKVKRRVSRESLCGSLRGSWPTPQNESKTSLLQTLRGQKSPVFWLRRLVFDSFWGVRRDPRRLLRRLPRRLFFDSSSRK